MKKITAEKAAKRVSGVKAVAEDIQVGDSISYRKTDTEIAEAVLNALKWSTAVREEKIKIKVEDGSINENFNPIKPSDFQIFIKWIFKGKAAIFFDLFCFHFFGKTVCM